MNVAVPYNQEIADKICDLLIDGMSLAKICQMNGMPSKFIVLKWLHQHDEFYEQYYKARQLQAEGMADEIVSIADDGTNDFVEQAKRNGTVVLADHEHINRSRLRMDARRFILAKLHPEKYGEKLDVNHHGGMTAQLIIKGREGNGDTGNDKTGTGSAG